MYQLLGVTQPSWRRRTAGQCRPRRLGKHLQAESLDGQAGYGVRVAQLVREVGRKSGDARVAEMIDSFQESPARLKQVGSRGVGLEHEDTRAVAAEAIAVFLPGGLRQDRARFAGETFTGEDAVERPGEDHGKDRSLVQMKRQRR